MMIDDLIAMIDDLIVMNIGRARGLFIIVYLRESESPLSIYLSVSKSLNLLGPSAARC